MVSTAVAGSCGPGSLHFINGILATRNRAPVMLIAGQIIRDELGFDFIQEVDFKQIYRDCSVFCDMVHTPEQARRKIVIACQTALAKRGVAVLIVPADISASVVDDSIAYAVHVSRPVTRPSDAGLNEIADILNKSENGVLYGGSGCQWPTARRPPLDSKMRNGVDKSSAWPATETPRCCLET